VLGSGVSEMIGQATGPGHVTPACFSRLHEHYPDPHGTGRSESTTLSASWFSASVDLATMCLTESPLCVKDLGMLRTKAGAHRADG